MTNAFADSKELWTLDGSSNPESVYQDSKRDVLYVSSVNGTPFDKCGNGDVSKVSPDGKMITHKWTTGLNAPRGMELSAYNTSNT